MKICTSYFAQMRKFKPHMIPLSTAIYPPKWFKGDVRKDKNGVYLGLEAKPFIPGAECHGLCHGHDTCIDAPKSCAFLRTYRKQLDLLDFDNIMSRFERMDNYIVSLDEIPYDELIFALMVFEAPTQECSERQVIHDWFAAHGYPIEELTFE